MTTPPLAPTLYGIRCPRCGPWDTTETKPTQEERCPNCGSALSFEPLEA